MKTMTERDGDIPKTVAVIISSIPSMVVRTGVIYLKTKRRIRKRSRLVMRGMVANGLSPELARRLADRYEEELSIRNLIRTFTPLRTK